MLFKGRKRKIPECEYSKLKQFPYHQLVSPRPKNQQVNCYQSHSRVQEVNQSANRANYDSLKNIIASLRHEIAHLQTENAVFNKQIIRNAKIQRITPKISESSKHNSVYQTDQNHLRKYQQFLLSLQVIQLQQKLMAKNEEHKQLFQSVNKNFKQNYNSINIKKCSLLQQIFVAKLEVGVVSGNKAERQTVYNIDLMQPLLDNQIRMCQGQKQVVAGKLKTVIKKKKRQSEKLSQINYLCTQNKMQTQQIQLKRFRKDPSQFIETRGGQMKSVDQLECEIEQIRQQTKAIYQNIERQMQQKIVDKITLRNQIERLLIECSNNLGNSDAQLIAKD